MPSSDPESSKRDSDLSATPMPKLRRPGVLTRMRWAVEDWVEEMNVTRFMYHILSVIYLCFILLLAYLVLPLPGHWPAQRDADNLPLGRYDNLHHYFTSFNGYSDCNIRLHDLYRPVGEDWSNPSHDVYCHRRKDVLEAMSSGGRVGFDAPYFPRNCHYRWYTVEEMCMVLERFDAVVFVRDESLQTVYNGFNILLRQDLTHGALKTWDMDKDTLDRCRCDNQFTSATCTAHALTSSDELTQTSTGKVGSPYVCSRIPHALLRITSSPAPQSIISKFKTLVPRSKRSNYHPIPVIHSLSPSTTSAEQAVSSLEEFLGLADASHRKTPMLWLGPTASGHTEIRGRKGNQEIWDFDHQLRSVAQDNDVEVLSMWNMSVQANSWDGARFGEKVAITQAMMVVNWLARLESS